MQSETNRNSLWLGAVVAIVIIGVIAYLALGDFGSSGDERPVPESSQPATGDSDEVVNQTDDADQPEANTVVTFTDSGFDSPTYRAQPGATVLVRNDSSQSLQFSSDDHPTHRDEPHLNTPVIGPGQTTTFTAPSDPGQYGFHDHIDARNTGVLIVE